jgi:hypothetical protein
MARWAVVLLVILGCRAQPRVEMPGQDQALAIVWGQEYGRRDAPPALRYVREPDLVCTDPDSGRPGFLTAVGCREGYTGSPWAVSIAWHQGDTFSTTTFAHELLHAALGRMGILDPLHKNPAWVMVDAANVRLAAAGY